MAQPVGFFTDTTLCIGCKACEVACKEWNRLPDNPLVFRDSYDNTGQLDHANWRHVRFIEQTTKTPDKPIAWSMMSDVCKHCANASCLEVCPTNAIVRTEFDTVFIQQDVCNGCRDCISACPYGVIGFNSNTGTAQKCTFCYDRLQNNPAAIKRERPGNVYAPLGDPRFPYVLTTYRLTEHHTSGAMTRVLSHLAELQPELFCEISPELAAERRIEHGAWVKIATARGVIRARAMVTRRLRPLLVEDRTVHQVGLPWHWGYRGLVTGDVANDLTAMSEDPNSRIMESKALLCDIAPSERNAHGLAE